MDLTGITNVNEYYTNHYLSSIFEENAASTISGWRAAAKESKEIKTPWSHLRENARSYYPVHNRYLRSHFDTQTLANIQTMADAYLNSLGYPEANPQRVAIDAELEAPIYLELTKTNGAPALWVLLAASENKEEDILAKRCFFADTITDATSSVVFTDQMTQLSNEELITKILFSSTEPPRFLLFIGMNQIALIDRNKWNEKRYLQFELNDIFSRREETTLQAMAVLLHKNSLCPEDGKVLLDALDENSQRHASGVSQDLKYALRECIELLGNEVLHDLVNNKGRNLDTEPVDAGQLTLECLRYMYRMLFVLFIEARPELGYAPIKAQSYLSGYSLESLRDIAEHVRDAVEEVGEGYYLHETLSKLYELIYTGYPATEEELLKYTSEESIHDMFVIAPLKAHIFDPEYTPMLTEAKLRNSVMLRIVELMSLTRPDGKRNSRRGRISYSNLGINQMGAVYEALLSYRGFIAEQDLYEVKRAGDNINDLDVGYFVPESELDQYVEEERVYIVDEDGKKHLRVHPKGKFIYRLAGREREKSASYYTPEVLTKCLVKYALKELLEGKTANEILQLTVCEPAMGSAAFLNEAINQLAEAYLDKKQRETGIMIPAQERTQELQKVKMFIADRNVYGIDLNPVAVELAEVSLWLNTIYAGGFVPWFGTQLVNGNSLIGARRQVYRVSQLTSTSKGTRWYENAPERILVGHSRVEQRSNVSKRQVYHFLLGDPGMASYSDKVIKQLEPDAIKQMNTWNKKFNEPYSDDEIRTLLYLSAIVDELWKNQIKLRKTIDVETQDTLSVFGHEDTVSSSCTTIRQKDNIYAKYYKSEHMKNAGPYARLKFAMDYWCALWFWPIDKAELLPSRSEFLNDLSLILEGTITTKKGQNLLASKEQSLFPTDEEELAAKIYDLFPGQSVVDLDSLCNLFPRLDLVRQIAQKNHFMHWELEFADLFAECGGFDLIIGNPPWIKMTWNEQSVLSDKHPMFAVKKLTAAEASRHRADALKNAETYKLYFDEFESMSGTQSFLNASQNYEELKGQQTNLFKCFLPQAWRYGCDNGVSAFIHPDGVFDDPNGGVLREKLYAKLRRHYQFTNELKLFTEVDHHMGYSLNVYCNKETTGFDIISNLFSATTIDDCYSDDGKSQVPGIKNESGEWEIRGHKRRIVSVGKKELSVFATLFDGSDNWKQARLPVIHARDYLDVLKCFVEQQTSIGTLGDAVSSSEMWHEVNDQKNGLISRDVHFPDTKTNAILSGPHIGVANPLFKTSRRICKLNSDYDPIDISQVQDDYLQRCNYSVACDLGTYQSRITSTPWGNRINDQYVVCSRKMLNLSGERTLITSIIPPDMSFINGIFGMAFNKNTALIAGSMATLPYDFFLRVTGKSNGRLDTFAAFPVLCDKPQADSIIVRSLMLNSLTKNYTKLWDEEYKDCFRKDEWSKQDVRLRKMFPSLSKEWKLDYSLRSDYERRHALIELDVLVAMALGMTLDQLKTIYHIQFPVLQSYEADTWYDANGRIVFTNNRSLVGVGYSRPEWENEIKDATVGKKFYRTITDDTMPGGPIERTIEYVAPFDRCDREKDYETAWKFFEEKYGRNKRFSVGHSLV